MNQDPGGIDEDAIAKLSENDRDDALSSLFDRLEAEKNATSRRVVLENREIRPRLFIRTKQRV